MKTYTFSFYGRQSGAIGIFYNITDTYEATSFAEACHMLYTDYEHITFHSAKEGSKQKTKEQFNFALCKKIRLDYKGKGTLRK